MVSPETKAGGISGGVLLVAAAVMAFQRHGCVFVMQQAFGDKNLNMQIITVPRLFTSRND